MGRTRRKRARINKRSEALDHEESAIKLRKFMSRNGFNDGINLKLRNFPVTGRGVASVKSLHENDVIIAVPYELMISYSTLKSVNFLHAFVPSSRLTIHDLLASFLVLQKHDKGSFWADYVNSLPLDAPWIPALLSEDYVGLLPDDLKLAVKKSRRLLEESWLRVKKSIKSDWTCSCCGKKADCVIDSHSFTWGYILVNTRAVYINPEVIRDWSADILSDEPCMALCPFLDMFNHSDKAMTRAELVRHEGKLIYQLTTLRSYDKHEQVFISYGEHNNVRLLVDYGFFIPGNVYDLIPIKRETVFHVLSLSLKDFQYKFICKHGLDEDLWFSETGPSFNLKGLLYVASSGDSEAKNLSTVVYNENYPGDFVEKRLSTMCRTILSSELSVLCSLLKNLKFFNVNLLIVDFLQCRIDFIKKLGGVCYG